MEYLIGLVLSVAVAGFATAIGLDRERAFCPPVLIVIASYYVLFAVLAGGFLFLLYSVSRGVSGSPLPALSVTEFLTSSTTCLLKTREYRAGGLVSA